LTFFDIGQDLAELCYSKESDTSGLQSGKGLIDLQQVLYNGSSDAAEKGHNNIGVLCVRAHLM
jgi:hypothetical protein